MKNLNERHAHNTFWYIIQLREHGFFPHAASVWILSILCALSVWIHVFSRKNFNQIFKKTLKIFQCTLPQFWNVRITLDVLWKCYQSSFLQYFLGHQSHDRPGDHACPSCWTYFENVNLLRSHVINQLWPNLLCTIFKGWERKSSLLRHT